VRHLREPEKKVGARIGAPPEAPSEQSASPIFCLRHIQKSHCISACDQSEQAAFATAMWERCQLTWSQLQLAPKKGLGSEKIRASSIRAGIPEIAKGVEFFLAFRFSGKKPMVGMRKGPIFHVFWLDRDFSLYGHGS
jgi:hypothetical protein